MAANTLLGLSGMWHPVALGRDNSDERVLGLISCLPYGQMPHCGQYRAQGAVRQLGRFLFLFLVFILVAHAGDKLGEMCLVDGDGKGEFQGELSAVG